MCGTYTLRNSTEAINEAFSLYSQLVIPGSFKIAPSTLNPVIVPDTDGNDMRLFKWGFRPQWMTDAYMKAKKRYPWINARGETLFTTPAFRGAARTSRCLIVADGFYEPKGPNTMKNRPYYFFQFPDERLFAFAGVTTTYQDDVVGRVDSYAIITIAPNDVVAPIHDRMPVILHPEDYDRWLDHSAKPEDLQPLLSPWDDDTLEHWRVSDYVKKRDAHGPDCIARI